jgi:hypothetical protein
VGLGPLAALSPMGRTPAAGFIRPRQVVPYAFHVDSCRRCHRLLFSAWLFWGVNSATMERGQRHLDDVRCQCPRNPNRNAKSEATDEVLSLVVGATADGRGSEYRVCRLLRRRSATGSSGCRRTNGVARVRLCSDASLGTQRVSIVRLPEHGSQPLCRICWAQWSALSARS